MTALRSFILTQFAGEVVQGVGNGVPMPQGAFIAITDISSIALSTNITTLINGNNSIARPSQFTVQVDCYGAASCDTATALCVLLRSQYGCDQFKTSGFEIQPLYAGDARKLPLVNGEQQYEDRWTFEAVLQYIPTVTAVQDSATALKVGLLEVDRTYPA